MSEEHSKLTPEQVWLTFRSEYEASFNARIGVNECQAWKTFAEKCLLKVLRKVLRHFENRWMQEKDAGKEPKRPSLAEIKDYYFNVSLPEYRVQKENQDIAGTQGSCQYCHNTGFAYAVRDDYSQKLLDASKPGIASTLRAFTDQVPCYCRIGQKEAENASPPDWWKNCLFSGKDSDEAFAKAEAFKERIQRNYYDANIKLILERLQSKKETRRFQTN